MEKQFIKINDPEHKFHNETFQVAFEGSDVYQLRGHGTMFAIKKTQGVPGEEKDLIKTKPNNSLENFLNSAEAPKVEDIPTCPPPEEEKADKIPVSKIMLDMFDKMQSRIAVKHSVVLPRNTIAGIVAIYFEEILNFMPPKDASMDMIMKCQAVDAKQQEESLK